MRKVVLKMDVSLDGFVAKPNGDLDWIFGSFNDELKACLVDTLWQADTHIMGRVAYNDMADHWSFSTEVFAPPMNEIPKVIFSKTLKEANWNRSRVVSGDIKEEVSRLKQQPGNYILAHGGARFAQSLSRFDLIDEYRLIIHPVVLGKGQPLFKNLADMINLKLLNTRVFHTGVVLHTYQPVRKGGSPQEN